MSLQMRFGAHGEESEITKAIQLNGTDTNHTVKPPFLDFLHLLITNAFEVVC